MTVNLKIFFTCIILYFISGCRDTDSIKHYKVPKSNHNINRQVVGTSSESNLKWIQPDSWIQYNGSSIRLLSFNVPYSRGQGDLSVMILEGDGGGLVANVNRWCRQLGIPDKTEDQIEDMADLINGSMGNYRIFKLIGESNNKNAFLCSILPIDKRTIFIKMSIDSRGISEVENDFKEFSSSLNLLQ